MIIPNTQNVSSDNQVPYRNDMDDMRPRIASARADANSPLPQTKEARYAKAAQQMHRGKTLVFIGFGILGLAMLVYCVVGVAAEPNQDFGMAFLADSRWLVIPAQAGMAIGTLLWLAGSFQYLLGALDSDPDGPDLYF